jgi:hypothetical protein
MKTKISAAVIALFFLMGCGSSEQPKQEEQKQPEAAVQNLKFIIKASNSQYVVMGPDSILVASEPIPTKALVFEKIDLENGKIGLRVPFGKYVCDDRGKEYYIYANKEHCSDWEMFEIVAVDQWTFHLKSSTGKYVSADQSLGNKLIANRDKPSSWETFRMEEK